jgi:hypothetical protein
MMRNTSSIFVMPAKAGIQYSLKSPNQIEPAGVTGSSACADDDRVC